MTLILFFPECLTRGIVNQTQLVRFVVLFNAVYKRDWPLIGTRTLNNVPFLCVQEGKMINLIINRIFLDPKLARLDLHD